jgi:peptidoglycan/LPS O-acetylase OafA/YrhL
VEATTLRREAEHAGRYRPDIDGLRAIAVLAVVGFHAGLSGFSGGFSGVDVFFVISGYLIGGIIYRGIERNDFSFAVFYIRRINRILPALLAVLAITVLLGWLLLFDNEFKTLGAHVLGGATFSSNFVLWNEYGYFDLPDKPLLHLWSLAVEEQFYLLFPLIAIAASKYRWTRRTVVIALIFFSFALNVWEVRHSGQNTAFFLPHTRMWEILAGVLLFDLEDSRRSPMPRQSLPKHWSNGQSLTGILCLAVTVALVPNSSSWPGLLAILPVAGTALLIAAGPNALVNRKVLSHPILVSIGLISYPLYLWHWPFFVFAKLINNGLPTVGTRLGLIALSVLLASATYFLIEKPIRFGSHKRRSAYVLTLTLALFGLIGGCIKSSAIESRLTTARADYVGKDWDVPQDGSLDNGTKFLFFHLAGDSTRKVVLFGDSHMQQYWPRIKELRSQSPRAFPQVDLIVYGGCLPLPRINRQGTSWDGNPWNCPGFYRAAMKYIDLPQVKSVVISGYWEHYFRDRLLVPEKSPGASPLGDNDSRMQSVWAEFEQGIAQLRSRGKRVFIVLSNPSTGRYENNGNKDQTARRLAGLFGRPALPDEIQKSEFLLRRSVVERALRAIAFRTGSQIIDPAEFLCGTSQCPTVSKDGIPIYKDDDHLRSEFVRTGAAYIDRITR